MHTSLEQIIILNFTSLLPRYENFLIVIPFKNWKPTPFALPKPLPTCFHKLISSRVLCVKIFCQFSWFAEVKCLVKCLQCQHIKFGVSVHPAKEHNIYNSTKEFPGQISTKLMILLRDSKENTQNITCSLQVVEIYQYSP